MNECHPQHRRVPAGRISSLWSAVGSRAARWLPWQLALPGLLACSAAAAAAPVPDAQALMDWAEKAYASNFPGHPATQTAAPYAYRYYAATGNYIGVAGSGVWLLGPLAGSSTTPLYVGDLSDFSCRVYAADCGDKQVLQVGVDGLTREFIVYLPWKARGQAGAPAVLVLHGTGGDGERFFASSGWREKADEEGLIAVFPTALTHCFYEDSNGNGVFDPGERQVTSKWAAGRLGNPAQRPLCTPDELAQLSPAQRALADHPLADDIAFVQQILATLGSRYGVDRRRVYATGFSNGAEMTARLAAEASTSLAAVACAAGPGPANTSGATRPMSVVYTVGQYDSEIAPKLAYTNGLPMTGALAFNTAFQSSLVTPFTSALQLGSGASHVSQAFAGVPTSQFLYRNSLTGASNALSIVVIGDLDHAYPNGINHPIRLADPLWDFFRGQLLP